MLQKPARDILEIRNTIIRHSFSVSEVFDRAIDKSPFGSDLENHLNGDAARAALSSAPYNYLQTLNLSNVQHVLDLSEDFGATAHYLSDHVATVESVKIDPDLARITIRRCVDRRNVRVILEDLEENLRFLLNIMIWSFLGA